jgi:hypothetical protein
MKYETFPKPSPGDEKSIAFSIYVQVVGQYESAPQILNFLASRVPSFSVVCPPFGRLAID